MEDFNNLSNLIPFRSAICDFIEIVSSYFNIYEESYMLNIMNEDVLSQISSSIDDYYTQYSIDNTDEIKANITYSNTSTEISVKTKYINSSIFKERQFSSISSIYLDDNIEFIQQRTFKGLRSLRQIHLPAKLKLLNDSQFKDCTNLETISLPKDLILIGHNTFLNCTSLSSIYFNNKLKFIGEDAFSKCIKLTSIDLPESIAILCNAFRFCGEIDTVKIPKTLKCLFPYVFNGSIVKSIASDEDVILKKFSHAFKKYKILKNLGYIYISKVTTDS